MGKFLSTYIILFYSFFCSCSKERDDLNLQDFEYYQMVEDVTNRVFTYSFGSKSDEVTKLNNRFTFIHFSDIHCTKNLWKENLYELINFSENPKIYYRIQVLIHTGDMCNGMPARNKNTTLSEIYDVNKILLLSNHKIINVVGNHDSNIEEASKKNIFNSYNCSFSKHEQYEYLIEPYLLKSNVDILKNEKCYYYSDFNDFKIRLIVLDFIDYPTEEDILNKGFLKYSEGFIFSQNQLEWLYQTLYNTPLGYGVIVASHGPFSTKLAVGKYAQGVNLIPDIINSYKNGSIYNHKWNCDMHKNLSTNLNFDFSSRDKGDFICYLSGHIHARVIAYPDKYNDQLIITTPQLFKSAPFNQDFKSYALHDYFIDRSTSYINKNSFNIISIDRENKKIYLTCYGAFRDISGHFTDRTKIINY